MALDLILKLVTGAANLGAAAISRSASIAQTALVLYSEVKRQVPRLEDEVVVEVKGQPGSTKRQLYYLALSTAFGIVRRFDIGINNIQLAVPTGVLMVEYDAADDWVRVTVRFNTGLAAAALSKGFQSIGGLENILGVLTTNAILDYINNNIGQINLYAQSVLFSGPKDEVLGGPFNFVGRLTPALPNTSNPEDGAPLLPFEGRTILTQLDKCRQPVPAPGAIGPTVTAENPKPPGDNRSRGSVVEDTRPDSAGRGLVLGIGPGFDANRKLIPLVFAALTDPGSETAQTFIPPTQGPQGG